MKRRLLAVATTAALVLGMSAALPYALGSVYPPPETVRSFDLGPPGWHSFVWTGASETAPEMALACIDGSYGVVYRWVGSTGAFERWVPERPAISNMGDLNKYDSLLVLITDSGAQCVGMLIDP